MSSSLHQTKKISRNVPILYTADNKWQLQALNSHIRLTYAFMLLFHLLCRADLRLKRGSRRTNTGLGGVTPCTQLCLPMLLLLAYEPLRFIREIFFFGLFFKIYFYSGMPRSVNLHML